MSTPRTLRKIVALVLVTLALAGARPKPPALRLATATIVTTRWPYLPGSLLPLRIDGIAPPYHLALLGPGRLVHADTYEIPAATAGESALLIAGNASAIGATRVRIARPPIPDRSLLFVASYDDGLVLHDARDFAVLGVLATGGVPSDVATDRSGTVAVTDTQGSALTLLRLAPWGVTRVADVVAGDDVAIDARTGAIFVSDREWNGHGALTRVTADGEVSRIVTGETAEGVAIDERRQLVYVANTNDGTIAVVDAASLRIVRRFAAAPRVFSLSLSRDGTLLYAVSNQSTDSPFGKAGRVVAISVGGDEPRVVARSGDLAFPLGVALDDETGTLFVSDEERREIDVLDARSLRATHAPLPTCAIPWTLTFDGPSERLYVPCAGDNEIDVIDARSLHRAAGAPFVTGGYPLAIAVWRP